MIMTKLGVWILISFITIGALICQLNASNDCDEGKFFKCDNEKCVGYSMTCDGVNDCADSSDETNCIDNKVEPFKIMGSLIHQLNASNACDGDTFFKCNNKRCVDRSMMCDGVNDCADNSDESDCVDDKVHSMFIDKSCKIQGQFHCKNGNCISNEKVCNRVDDCFDGSDEFENCTQHLNCSSPLEFNCTNRYCIKYQWTCDGENDCGDNSDEECKHENPCIEGYHFDSEKEECVDTNECIDNTNSQQLCDHECQNNDASYLCICNYGYSLGSDGKTCIMNNHNVEPLLIFATHKEIKEFHLKANYYYPTVKNLSGANAITQNDNYIYWSDNKYIHRILKSNGTNLSSKNMNESEIVVNFGTGQIYDIEIDWKTGNIYFTDNLNHRIMACTANGTYCTIINDNLHVSKLHGLALHPSSSQMFWIEGGHKPGIYRSRMDGGFVQPIVKQHLTNPHNLVIDYPAKRIYFTNDNNITDRNIESCDFNGTDRHITIHNFTVNATMIYIFEDKLYWYNNYFKTIEYCPKLNCKIQKTLIVIENHMHVNALNIYHPIIVTSLSNPCASKRCSDICLLSSFEEAACACSIGNKLSTDKSNCYIDPADEYIIISAGEKIIRYHQNNTINNTYDILNYKISSMVLNTKNQELLFTNELHTGIYSYNLINKKSFLLFKLPDHVMVNSLSYDYYGNNIYATNINNQAIDIYSLTSFKKSVIKTDKHPIALIVAPEKAEMVIAQYDIVQSHINIVKTTMMGVLIKTIKTNINAHYFTMDLDENTLIFSANNKIFSIELTTMHLKLIHEDRNDINSVMVLNNIIYWSTQSFINWKKNFQVFQDHIKEDGVKAMLIVAKKQQMSYKHVCNLENDGCSDVCMALTPTTSKCGCSIDEELSNDNKTCRGKKSTLYLFIWIIVFIIIILLLLMLLYFYYDKYKKNVSTLSSRMHYNTLDDEVNAEMD